MKLQFSSKETIIIVTLLIILIVYIVLAQYYFLGPLKSDLQLKQQTLQSEQKLVEVIQQKQTGNTKSANDNTTELQKELPVKPLQDQFILDLQQAEAVSDSQIKSMSFTDGGQAAGNNIKTNIANNSAQTLSGSTSGQTNSPVGSAQQQNTGNSNQLGASGSPVLSKITAQLNIVSPHYEDLEKFINTLESLKRITVIEAINYTGTSEITSLEQENKPLNFTLTVSAYYLPGLKDLEKQLPKVDYPVPANKENPLSQFADIQNH